MIQDSTHSIQKSATRFLSGTLISRVSGMLRDMAMAFAFGSSGSLSAFMVAYRFAHLARRLFGEGSLQNIFVPHFEAFRLKDPATAFRFFRDLTSSLFLLLLGLVITASIPLFWGYHATSHPEMKEIFLYTLLMLPSLIFICLYGLNSALLSCEKIYFLSSLAPTAFNFIWIAGALFLADLPIEQAMIGMSLSVIIACMAQWLFTVPPTLNCIPRTLRQRFWIYSHPFSEEVRTLFRPFLLANFGVAASQINNALDPLFAIYANNEGPAWLWYAIRVQQLPLSLFGIALTTALIPPISRAIKGGHMEQFQQFFCFAKRKMALFSLLMTAGILATAPTCIHLLFGRGQFGMESVEGTALCLIGYSIGLLPMMFVLIAAPVLFALGDYKTPSKGALVSMGINIALNSLLVFGFELGAASVALATSFAAFWNARFLKKTLEKKAGKKKVFHGKIVLLAALAMGGVFIVDWLSLGEIPSLQLLTGTPLHLSPFFADQLILFTKEALAFSSISLLGAYLLNLFRD